jgi:hypothetical protein
MHVLQKSIKYFFIFTDFRFLLYRKRAIDCVCAHYEFNIILLCIVKHLRKTDKLES